MLDWRSFRLLFPDATPEGFAHCHGIMDSVLINTPERCAHFLGCITFLDEVPRTAILWYQHSLNQYADADDRLAIIKAIKPRSEAVWLLLRLRRFALAQTLWSDQWQN